MYGKAVVEKALDELEEYIARGREVLKHERQHPHVGNDELSAVLSNLHKISENAFNDYRVEHRIGYSTEPTQTDTE